MEDKNNLLAKILYEAKSYDKFEDIEKLVEKGLDLSNIPVQPLYVSLLSAPSEQVANILPRLSSEQRQALLDLDLWNRDTVDVFSFEYWIDVYSKCLDDDVAREFVESDDFLLYLKSRVNIHTFDVEDPQYPDHDNYFLTDDSLLLIEYADSYERAQELKFLIRRLYDARGVEGAYSSLFKLINDSFSLLQENEYQNKKERLREYGFVDYFEAKERLHPFLSLKGLERFIDSKAKVAVDVDARASNQSLHSSALTQFDLDMENILFELSKVKEESRRRFLRFSFVRLINSTIALHDALRGGSVELAKIGKGAKAMLELGLQHIKTGKKLGPDESIFDYFDFGEVYKAGATLWDVNRRKIKKALKLMELAPGEQEAFLGAWWNSFIEGSFEDIPKVKNFGVGRHPQEVKSLETWKFWRAQAESFVSMAPFIGEFLKAFKKLKEESKLNDQFYLNYNVADMDFEALMLSSFINYTLGNFTQDKSNKMGVAVEELKLFLSQWFVKAEEEYVLKPQEDLQELLASFQTAFGMDQAQGFPDYLYGVLYEHLSGYEFDSLSVEDFAHVGGPVILNALPN